MTDTLEGLRRRIDAADKLHSIVHTMKALAASNIGQYERAVTALADYHQSIEYGLIACIRKGISIKTGHQDRTPTHVAAVVFGSDQGLVGEFNLRMSDFVRDHFARDSQPRTVWTVGERLEVRLVDEGVPSVARFDVPNSVASVSTLIDRLLLQIESFQEEQPDFELYVFHHQPLGSAGYQPVSQRLLPLDRVWLERLMQTPWPSRSIPDVLGDYQQTMLSLISELLFVSLFKACVESMASENASRLSAMQRAEKNIGDTLVDLNQQFHRLRQESIDEELFDLVNRIED